MRWTKLIIVKFVWTSLDRLTRSIRLLQTKRGRLNIVSRTNVDLYIRLTKLINWKFVYLASWGLGENLLVIWFSWLVRRVPKKKIACLPTKHIGVHMNSFKRVRAFQIELEFGSVGFWGEGKTGVPGEKPLGARERTNNKLNPHMASTPGVEPGPHWWEASVLTTAPPLLPDVWPNKRS